MATSLKQLDPNMEEFGAWLSYPHYRTPRGTMLHHTWSPSAAQYKGLETIRAIRNYHVGKGWSDIAANAYACPDGQIVTGRTLAFDNWCHGYIARETPEAELWRAADHDRMFPNRYLVGFETVANFDSEDPHGSGPAGRSFECVMDAIEVTHRLFGLPPEMLFFHRDAENKSCPGTKLNRVEVRQELARRLATKLAPLVVGLNGRPIPCDPIMVGEEMTCAAGALLDAIGVPLTAIRPGTVHANGRAYIGELGEDCAAHGWALAFRQRAQGPRVYIKRAKPE
jgi:hypothetical protein